MTVVLLNEARHRPFLSAAFGGGGPFGVAYALGVVDALTDGGVSLDDSDLLGTSAGAWVAGCIATGTGFERLCDIPQLRVPNPRAGLLRELARDVFGDVTSARVTASAVRLPDGRRTLLSADDRPVADVVAASSAVPGLFRPVRLGRMWYVDGGVRSLVSADRAAPAQHLLAVAPIAGAMFGPAGRAMEAMLREELRRWETRTGGRAHLVRPGEDIARLTRHPLQLFDKSRARAVYPLAYEQTQRLLRERPDFAALAAPRPSVVEQVG
jgi:NTE family protein